MPPEASAKTTSASSFDACGPYHIRVSSFLRPRCQCPWITSYLWPLVDEASLMVSISSFCRSGWSFSRVIEYLTCRRHACMISSGGWSARSARRLGSARQRPCSSLPRARASRRRKTKRKTEIRLPLSPQQRTCGDCIGRSVLCQQETYAPQQFNSLFDHFVGPGEQRLRNVEAKRFCGLEIDHQLDFS